MNENQQLPPLLGQNQFSGRSSNPSKQPLAVQKGPAFAPSDQNTLTKTPTGLKLVIEGLLGKPVSNYPLKKLGPKIGKSSCPTHTSILKVFDVQLRPSKQSSASQSSPVRRQTTWAPSSAHSPWRCGRKCQHFLAGPGLCVAWREPAQSADWQLALCLQQIRLTKVRNSSLGCFRQAIAD